MPDGLRSLISWIADLLGRIDLLKWKDDLLILEKNLILFLDEIEVHLHPAWQRKVLPVVQKLFKNSQILFRHIRRLSLIRLMMLGFMNWNSKNGKAKVREKSLTKTTESFQTVVRRFLKLTQSLVWKLKKIWIGFTNCETTVKNR